MTPEPPWEPPPRPCASAPRWGRATSEPRGVEPPPRGLPAAPAGRTREAGAAPSSPLHSPPRGRGLGGQGSRANAPARRAAPGRPVRVPTHPEASPGLPGRLLLLSRGRTFPPARQPRTRLHLPLRQPPSLRGPGGRGAAAAGAEPRRSPSASRRVGAAATRGGRARPLPRAPLCSATLCGVKEGRPGGNLSPLGRGTPSPETRGSLQVGSFACA